ncbi:hypothetical protein ACSQ67_001750 [Phaseolus vulgaris]
MRVEELSSRVHVVPRGNIKFHHKQPQTQSPHSFYSNGSSLHYSLNSNSHLSRCIHFLHLHSQHHHSPSLASTHQTPILGSLPLSQTRRFSISNPGPPPQTPPQCPSAATTQVYPKSYGGYSIDLNFGTPPQTSPFVLDTGSSLVWFPCTSRYLCSHCLFPNIDPTKIPTFIPKNSSTSRLLGCKNPKCGYLFGSDLQSRCPQCKPDSQNCSLTCPPYIIQYGLGSTAGFLLLDNLNFPEKIVPQFLVGCSILSIRQPSGIAGFGRGQESLPAQMALKRFSYCLLSHNFDDSTENSDLVLQISSTGDTKTNGLSYTPFHPNPSANNPAFLEYYYLSLRKVIVGGKNVKIPLSFWSPALTQLGNYSRAEDVEAQSGLGPCFNISGAKTVNFPKFTLQFKGGAKMTLPVENYFSLIDDSEVVCLTIVSDGGAGPATTSGPAIILGNYQQQNFHIEYDLENERFGFGPQSCKRKA